MNQPFLPVTKKKRYTVILVLTYSQIPIPVKSRTFQRLFTITRNGDIRLSLGGFGNTPAIPLKKSFRILLTIFIKLLVNRYYGCSAAVRHDLSAKLS
jgi:hypothetical protein